MSWEEILCPACVFSGTFSWIKRRRGEKTSAFINYLSSFWALGNYCKIWRNACKEHSFFPFFWGGGRVLKNSFCLVLAHCFCPARLRFGLVSPFPLLPPQSSLIFFPGRTVRVSLYECCRVSLKSTDDGSCGPGRGAADTPLPHPEQLLILRNRIISAKVAVLFRSREQMVNKPRELAVRRGAADMQPKTASVRS